MPPTKRPTGSCSDDRPQPTHTANDLTAALAEVLRTPRGDGGSTTQELMQALGLRNNQKMLELLQALHRQGRLKSGRALRPAIDGFMRPVSVYQIKP
jgi:hypothetical protein